MRRKTGVLDINGVEICEGDVITTNLGAMFEIFWEENKQTLMARRTDLVDVDEELIKLVKEQIGIDVTKFSEPTPFHSKEHFLGFEDSYKIINGRFVE